MKKLKYFALISCAAVGLICVTTVLAGAQDGKSDISANAKSQGVTAQDQGAPDKHWRRQDELATQKIRKAVEHEKGLSLMAKNVAIITRHGMVTLKGRVKSEDEKKKIVDDATGVVGADKISDQIVLKDK